MRALLLKGGKSVKEPGKHGSTDWWYDENWLVHYPPEKRPEHYAGVFYQSPAHILTELRSKKEKGEYAFPTMRDVDGWPVRAVRATLLAHPLDIEEMRRWLITNIKKEIKTNPYVEVNGQTFTYDPEKAPELARHLLQALKRSGVKLLKPGVKDPALARVREELRGGADRESLSESANKVRSAMYVEQAQYATARGGRRAAHPYYQSQDFPNLVGWTKIAQTPCTSKTMGKNRVGITVDGKPVAVNDYMQEMFYVFCRDKEKTKYDKHEDKDIPKFSEEYKKATLDQIAQVGLSEGLDIGGKRIDLTEMEKYVAWEAKAKKEGKIEKVKKPKSVEKVIVDGDIVEPFIFKPSDPYMTAESTGNGIFPRAKDEWWVCNTSAPAAPPGYSGKIIHAPNEAWIMRLQPPAPFSAGKALYLPLDSKRGEEKLIKKFDRAGTIGAAIPTMSGDTVGWYDEDAKVGGRKSQLGIALELLMEFCPRVGADENKYTGLTTLQFQHLLKTTDMKDGSGKIHLRFRGKSGVLSDKDDITLSPGAYSALKTLKAKYGKKGDAQLMPNVSREDITEYFARRNFDFLPHDFRRFKGTQVYTRVVEQVKASISADKLKKIAANPEKHKKEITNYIVQAAESAAVELGHKRGVLPKMVTQWKSEGVWEQKKKERKIEEINFTENGKTVKEYWQPDTGNTARKHYIHPVVQRDFLKHFGVNPDDKFGRSLMMRNVYFDEDELKMLETISKRGKGKSAAIAAWVMSEEDAK